MKQYDVTLNFKDDGDGEPDFYFTDDGKLKWPYDKVHSYDWKEQVNAARGLAKLAKRGPVAELFAGDDTINYASMKDVIKVKKAKR